jgi:hypothetical protein
MTGDPRLKETSRRSARLNVLDIGPGNPPQRQPRETPVRDLEQNNRRTQSVPHPWRVDQEHDDEKRRNHRQLRDRDGRADRTPRMQNSPSIHWPPQRLCRPSRTELSVATRSCARGGPTRATVARSATAGWQGGGAARSTSAPRSRAVSRTKVLRTRIRVLSCAPSRARRCARWSVDGPSRDDPLAALAGDGRDPIEVGVVVQNAEVAGFCSRRDQ